jgi:hypothetical protein
MNVTNHNVTIPMADYQKMIEAEKKYKLLIEGLKQHFKLLSDKGIIFNKMEPLNTPKSIQMPYVQKTIIDYVY